MIGNTRPTNKKRKTEIHRSLYKIFGPRWELEQLESKNNLNTDEFSDMKKEEKDIRLKPALKKKKIQKKTKDLNEKIDVNRVISSQELQKHKDIKDAWIAIHGKVFDISGYIKDHPGGIIILQHAGKDASKEFGILVIF